MRCTPVNLSKEEDQYITKHLEIHFPQISLICCALHTVKTLRGSKNTFQNVLHNCFTGPSIPVCKDGQHIRAKSSESKQSKRVVLPEAAKKIEREPHRMSFFFSSLNAAGLHFTDA